MKDQNNKYLNRLPKGIHLRENLKSAKGNRKPSRTVSENNQSVPVEKD